ncbi:hypothetical protein IEO21_01651 [Rhodonia placenta]|uniref:Man1/Src1 C-terminal domain-containing protein n=1 Tax=Rhodonia placenta TaxID=104341 RepID=A0A8H7U577_9APHY|nr:hypothetical protein IEO21_01651 [Postia placenta]
MSRLTAAQVIAIGDYLEPDFDPASLTVPQLLGIFGYHNINYPSQYTKPKLVQLFSDEIKPKVVKLKRERSKKENSQASDDGIKDGVTGRPLNEGKKQIVRRSSRRSSQAPSSDPPEPEQAPPKRRRSSAQPTLGGPSRRKTTKPTQPVVVEESEPEDEIVVRKVGRSKKGSTDAGSQARRVSQAFPDDSGWEDNNIFQSGAESSPARPSPVRPRTRRSSAIPRPAVKSRKSMSAPPQYASEKGKEPAQPEPAASEEPEPAVKPPSSNFEPHLPPSVARQSRATTSRTRAKKGTPAPEAAAPSRQIEALRNAIAADAVDVPTKTEPHDPPITEEEEEEDIDDEAIDEQVAAVSQRISEGGRPVQRDVTPASGPSFLVRCILLLLALSGSGVLLQYKHESARIGFCDTGKATNAVLEDNRARWSAIDSCNRENRTSLYLADSTAQYVEMPLEDGAEQCPPLALIPLPHPETCTPCPRHATCTPSTMTCDNGYILRSHPLLSLLPVPGTSSSSSLSSAALNTFTRPGSLLSPSADIPELVYSAISLLLDGIPGIGPVALAPRCAEDPRRRRHIGALGKAIEAMLAAERGRRICAGMGADGPEGDDATEAQRWGLELGKLKDDLKKKTAPNLLPTLDDTFNEAIQQLVQWGGVFIGEDSDGKRYLAHRTPSMGWECTVKVKARDAWMEWRRALIGSALLVLSMLFFRRRQAHNVVENERVAALVQIALDLLRNQELAHHTDPVTAPQPYLSSLQLRDLILQDEHSVGIRRRLWERVERVVEGNANVRTNLEEVEGGDELRVWRWVGSAGAISPGSGGRKNMSEKDQNTRIVA